MSMIPSTDMYETASQRLFKNATENSILLKYNNLVFL